MQLECALSHDLTVALRIPNPSYVEMDLKIRMIEYPEMLTLFFPFGTS